MFNMSFFYSTVSLFNWSYSLKRIILWFILSGRLRAATENLQRIWRTITLFDHWYIFLCSVSRIIQREDARPPTADPFLRAPARVVPSRGNCASALAPVIIKCRTEVLSSIALNPFGCVRVCLCVELHCEKYILRWWFSCLVCATALKRGPGISTMVQYCILISSQRGHLTLLQYYMLTSAQYRIQISTHY